MPERYFQFMAGFFKAGARIPAAPTFITARTTTDFSLLHIITDIGFTAIGMQRSFWSIENYQTQVMPQGTTE